MQWPRISRAFTKTFHLPPANDVDFNVTLSLNLHLQHWMQRDHTVNQIQRVRADAREKPRVAAEWNGRQQEFLKTWEELSTYRQKLERKRVEVESQVVERYFR
jgi:hypothetical protein